MENDFWMHLQSQRSIASLPKFIGVFRHYVSSFYKILASWNINYQMLWIFKVENQLIWQLVHLYFVIIIDISAGPSPRTIYTSVQELHFEPIISIINEEINGEINRLNISKLKFYIVTWSLIQNYEYTSHMGIYSGPFQSNTISQ